MVERKVQTSFRLSKEEDTRYKELAEKKGIPFNQLVRDTLAAAYTNPDFLNPTKPPSDGDKILQGLKKAQNESLQEQETVISEIVDRLARLETKFDSMMNKFEVEQPAKDKSGKRVFDD